MSNMTEDPQVWEWMFAFCDAREIYFKNWNIISDKLGSVIYETLKERIVTEVHLYNTIL